MIDHAPHKNPRSRQGGGHSILNAGDPRSVAVLAGRAVDMVMAVIVAVIMLMVIMPMVIVAMAVVVMGMMAVMRVVVMVVGVILVRVMRVPMVSVVVVSVVVPAGAVVVGRRLLLRAERALQRRRGAALAADQLRHHRIVEDIERVRRHLGLDVVAAELPGQAGQADRVLGRDRQQGLRGGEDPHQPAVIEAHRVAILQDGLAVKVELEGEAALGRQRGTAAGAGGMVEGDLVGDGVGAHGGFADDGCGALHRDLTGVMPGISPLL